MRTHPATRTRTASEKIAGGLTLITNCLFGCGSPISGDEFIRDTDVFYNLHQGDLFTPGTGNWVLDPSLETPLQINSGHGFTFANSPTPVYQPPQVYADPNALSNGQRGIISGQVLLQPLLPQNPAKPFSF